MTAVRVTDEGDGIRLNVADNGNTIQSEKAKEIRENLHTGARDHGIGLVNVFSKLVLCKGENSAIDIEVLPGDGIMVTLRWRRGCRSKPINHHTERRV